MVPNADHVAIARHIHPFIDGGTARRVELLAVVQDHSILQDLSVQRAFCQPAFTVSTYCPYNIVLVCQTVVGEIAIKVAVETLIGGYPETVPAVNEQVFD